MSTTDTAQLDYAPAAPFRRRRRIRRVVAMVLVLAVAWSVYQYGGPVWQKGKLLYYQRRCLTFTAPPDQVVYDDDPADVAVVGARRDYQVLNNTNFRAPNFPRMAAYAPTCWNDFTAAAFPKRSALSSSAVIFCHELVSHDGVRRLIVIERDANPDPSNYRVLHLEVIYIQPATLNSPAIDLTPLPRMVWMTGAVAKQMTPLRIYAGQVDPADASRFTIRYTMGTKEGLVKGQLTDGGNEVTLSY